MMVTPITVAIHETATPFLGDLFAAYRLDAPSQRKVPGSVLDTNLVASFRVAKRATPNMVKKRFGRLIFVGSASGLSGVPGQANYTSAKAGLIGLARTLARELGSSRRAITANVVTPGFTETDMAAAVDEKHLAMMKDLIPLQRFGQPEEIAGLVAYLASDLGGFVNGQVINVDGGIGMGH